MLLFVFQAEDGIRDLTVTGVQTCALPICRDRIGVALARDQVVVQLGIGPVDAQLDVGRSPVPEDLEVEPAHGGAPLVLGHEQIGRATCRERVYNWGVAV